MASGGNAGVVGQVDVQSAQAGIPSKFGDPGVWSWIWIAVAILVILGYHVKVFGRALPPDPRFP